MSEPRLFPDETQERLFQAARAAAADFIPLMISILTGLTTPTLKALRRAVRRGLVPAEAIARRMIWMLAGQLASAAPARTPQAPRPHLPPPDELPESPAPSAPCASPNPSRALAPPPALRPSAPPHPARARPQTSPRLSSSSA